MFAPTETSPVNAASTSAPPNGQGKSSSMVMGQHPQIPKNRLVERQGLRAAADLFERRHHVFQEVPLQHDFGRDALVDFVHEGEMTGLSIGLQIKSGASYRRSDGDYFIPVGAHGSVWRDSTVPIFGIVFDPDCGGLFWADITRVLTETTTLPAAIQVSKVQRLDSALGYQGMLDAVKRHAQQPTRDLGARLLSRDQATQIAAVGESWALARHAPHSLVLLRRLITELSPAATRNAIWLLALALGNPDVYYDSKTWLPAHVRDRLSRALGFSAQELTHLLSCVDVEEWQRGGLGQALDVMLFHDQDISEEIVQMACRQLSAQGLTREAVRLIGSFACRLSNPSDILDRLSKLMPGLLEDPLMVMWRNDAARGDGIGLY
ncbi:hypothetical protein C7E18_00330 [Stenotrophomonas maltophilia]|nr:hypothetical protein C7E18_00330 [Stenotrophomonas maltophilia]